MGFGTGEELWALELGRRYGLWYWGGHMGFGTGEDIWALVLVRRYEALVLGEEV